MFNKLKNRIVLIVSAVAFVILFASFSIIYISSSKKLNIRNVIPIEAPNYNEEITNIITERIRYEREYANRTLLSVLIRSGIAIELIVVVVSALLAEEIIKPVKKTYESQKEFIANASHEIKTPLASIQANLEAANITDNVWINNVAYEADKLSRLNSDLLKLSRMDNTLGQVKSTKIKCKDFLEQIISSVRPRLESKKLSLEVADVSILINKYDLEELINILLDNAIKYSKSRISIDFTDKHFIIKNDGKNIPKEKLEHIFERFYQINKSSEGVGLGLSIAQSISEKNKWQICAESNSTETTFKVIF